MIAKGQCTDVMALLSYLSSLTGYSSAVRLLTSYSRAITRYIKAGPYPVCNPHALLEVHVANV